jgi:formiminoglutamase
MVSLLGAHTFTTSLTPRSGQSTPAAVRTALTRFSTWSFEDRIDLAEAICVHDRGDIAEPDSDEGRAALDQVFDDLFANFWILLGGDNALTWRALTAMSRGRLDEWGLITLDAHLDMREGRSNGSPVRQLLDEGLSGSHVVQVALADFSNSAAYVKDALDAGATLIPRHELRSRGVAEVAVQALAVAGAGAGGRPIYVDIDMDVCDRSVVPGCPAAAPGGLSADELREFVRLVCAHPQVHAIDVTEIDVARDAPDERTVRLAALVVLEALTGYVRRRS